MVGLECLVLEHIKPVQAFNKNNIFKYIFSEDFCMNKMKTCTKQKENVKDNTHKDRQK